jgi:hypothetical protein
VLVVGQQRPEVAHAQSAGGGGSIFGVTGNTQPGAKDVLWLIDARTDEPRLVVYENKEAGRLTLLAARNIKYDLMYDQYPGAANAHRPTVDQVRKEVTRSRGK